MCWLSSGVLFLPLSTGPCALLVLCRAADPGLKAAGTLVLSHGAALAVGPFTPGSHQDLCVESHFEHRGTKAVTV